MKIGKSLSYDFRWDDMGFRIMNGFALRGDTGPYIMDILVNPLSDMFRKIRESYNIK